MANEKRLIDANRLKMRMIAFATAIKREYLSIEAIVDTINTEDTVEAVEVVHGRWLFDSNTERCFCSACNEEALYTSKDEPIFDYDWEENLRYSHTETYLEEHLTNYCPNCGAKMDL